MLMSRAQPGIRKTPGLKKIMLMTPRDSFIALMSKWQNLLSLRQGVRNLCEKMLSKWNVNLLTPSSAPSASQWLSMPFNVATASRYSTESAFTTGWKVTQTARHARIRFS